MRGEMRMRGREWHPGRSGKQVVTEVRWLVKAWWSTPESGGEASRPEVSRRPEVKGGTPEIGKREECQWWDVHARQGLVPRKPGEASYCRGEMRSKKEL